MTRRSKKNRLWSRFFLYGRTAPGGPYGIAPISLTGLRPMPKQQRQQPKLRRLQRPKRSMLQRLRPKQQPKPKQPTYRLQRSEQPFR
ncbi:MAG: hypothetical protein CBHOC_2567 [uncultured Caballeronia sp.]|nr:MAG: hypothetical protein CBHOC_2567 [uncultured Caballeronia sp.]